MTDSESALTTTDDKQIMGRLAAAIWAAVAFFAAVSTLGQLRPPGADIEMMRGIAVGSAVMAGVLMLFPWHRVPKVAFNIPLVLMTVTIGALAYAEGSVRTDLTLLFTFIVIFAAYFLSLRASLFQLLLIGVLLAARVYLPELGLDTSAVATKSEAVRLALLLPALGGFAALIAVLRKRTNERERKLSAALAYDYQTGLLSKNELVRVLDAALVRASQHVRPLAVVVIDVSGEMLATDPERRSRVATMVARSILGRIRVEDRAARISDFRFAVLGPETDSNGAGAFSQGLAEVIRKRLMTLGYESSSFALAVGWADFPRSAQSSTGLLDVARRGVEASIAANHGAANAPSTEAPLAPDPSMHTASPDT